MSKKKITKIVGYLSEEIMEKYNLYEYKNKPIVQSLDLYVHIEKHISDFKSVDSFNYTVSNIDKIIKEPQFVFFEKDRNSLLYYKKLDENVCVVVKLRLRDNKDSYVASVYPVSEYKIQKMIEKSYIKEEF